MNEPFIFQTLTERIAALFPEIDSDTAIDLLHNNDEYGQLHQRRGTHRSAPFHFGYPGG
jgi:hypothetical protein